MAIGSPQWMYSSGSDYELEQSLKFEDSRVPHLSTTFASAGNRKTYTFSCWIKRSVDTGGQIFVGENTSTPSNSDYLQFQSNNKLRFFQNGASSTYAYLQTNQVFRDSSAWYNIVLAVDTTQSTASNRVKIYINGIQITSFATETYPNQHTESYINSNVPHGIGAQSAASSLSSSMDGYLGEVNFIDGQALTPADFGETGDYGEWKPIEYSGTYGTNGFYLPFKQDYTVEGFSTVTYKGNGGTQYIGGTGFQPDMLWVKERTSTSSHQIHDAIRGAGKALFTNSTSAESSSSTYVSSFNTDGFNVGSSGSVNSSSDTYVAWNWDMGGSNASNTNGSITSTVRANPTYGQSIVSYNGTEANATVGHGLSSAPEMIITKSRGHTSDWGVYHASMGANKVMYLHSTSPADTDTTVWQNTTPTSSVFSIGNTSYANADYDYIAYCFHSVTGYSKFGSYTGNGSSTGPSVTTGFKPAFVMIKITSDAGGWEIWDSTRNPNNPLTNTLQANLSNAELTSSRDIDFTNTGFQIKNTTSNSNASGGTYIYMAFADKREYAYWLDQSGNNNDWTSNNLTESDVMVDSPTNNFATLNPLDAAANCVISEGNLKYTTDHSAQTLLKGTFNLTNKHYWEFFVPSVTGDASAGAVGIANPSALSKNGAYATWAGNTLIYTGSNGNKSDGFGGSSASYGATYTTGDIVGIAVDVPSGTIQFFKNNASQGTITDSTITTQGNTNTLLPVVANNSTSGSRSFIANFGQDSSFAGTKTAQGNQDSGGVGDFYYTPPTGFLALCTKNLPDVDVVPSEHFDVRLRTGTGSEVTVSDLAFQPDLLWTKTRSNAVNHNLHSSLMAQNYSFLQPNTSNAENSSASTYYMTPTSTGYTVGTGDNINQNTYTFVDWLWKAGGGSGSSNTTGSINSTVSANTDAGFSIVGWVGNEGSDESIGHGLSKAPEMILTWVRDEAWGNQVYHKDMGTNKKMMISETTAAETDTDVWADTAPTSSVFYVGTDLMTNWDDRNYIGYCFHSVDGYSKCGSYEGNDSADGTFVYTGFRPAFVMVKNIDDGYNWIMSDTKREPTNVMANELYPNTSAAEYISSGERWDFLSNGFKLRSGSALTNEDTYIYIAFAETPFKYSNAR